jgi:hypothetical protein
MGSIGGYVNLKRFKNKEYLKGVENRANLKLKYINLRQLGGIIAFIVGGFLVYFALDAMKQIAQAKGLTHDVSNFFEHNPGWNPIVTFFGGKAQERISQYDAPVMLALIIGIVLVALGAFIFLHYRTRIKSKNK